jgi:hypothetical protein
MKVKNVSQFNLLTLIISIDFIEKMSIRLVINNKQQISMMVGNKEKGLKSNRRKSWVL